MAITKEAKTAIINSNIQQIKNTLYNLEITARVNKKVGDDKGTDDIKKQMVELEKKVEEFNNILKEVEKEE